MINISFCVLYGEQPMIETRPIEPVIVARNLEKVFGAFKAVDDISFHVVPGVCFGILGPNGAGKTSTIRMLYGFSPLTAGDIFVFGLNIKTHDRKIKARIGVCQQENTLDPDLTVMQNFEVFARYFDIGKKTARARATTLLKFFALEQRQNARATELSGGMVRRLVIARALINQPDLIILDEPTTGLDPQSRHQVWERLEQLKNQGMTILLTTHYMEEAARLCDRVAVIDRGRVIALGTPRDLVAGLGAEHVIEFAVEGGALAADGLLALPSVERAVHEDGRWRLTVREVHRAVPALLSWLSDRGREASQLSTHHATLEDVFMALTGRRLRDG